MEFGDFGSQLSITAKNSFQDCHNSLSAFEYLRRFNALWIDSPRFPHCGTPAKNPGLFCVLAHDTNCGGGRKCYFFRASGLSREFRNGRLFRLIEDEDEGSDSSRPRSLKVEPKCHPDLREDCLYSLWRAGTEVEYFETPMDNVHCGTTLAMMRGVLCLLVRKISPFAGHGAAFQPVRVAQIAARNVFAAHPTPNVRSASGQSG